MGKFTNYTTHHQPMDATEMFGDFPYFMRVATESFPSVFMTSLHFLVVHDRAAVNICNGSFSLPKTWHRNQLN